jgi:ABC-type uncharacterized transport system substrate-binding protein
MKRQVAVIAVLSRVSEVSPEPHNRHARRRVLDGRSRSAHKTLLGTSALAASVILFLTMGASAHPHVWVTVVTTVVHDEGNFTGLQHTWTFDEAYTATAIAGLDKNHDGVYDREELAELAKVNIDGLKEFGYFTYPLLAGQAVLLGEARDYWLEHKNGLLSLTFTLPFPQPIAAKSTKDLTLLILDPTYFVAFELAKANPVRLAEGAPQSCKVTIADLEEGSEEAHHLSKAFPELGPDLGYTRTAAISCGGP